jgi:hypothetical protein
MADEIVETVEQKLERWAYVIDAQAKEIDRLRAQVASLTEGADAISTLRSIYRDRDLPESLRAKAAIGCLPHEVPRLLPEKAAIDLPAEEIIPLPQLIEQRRARQKALQGRDIEVTASGAVRILPKPGSNGSNGQDD